jgi:hypothetical protein
LLLVRQATVQQVTVPLVLRLTRACIWRCVGVITVAIGGATATNVVVVGPNWLRGTIPDNAAGTCNSNVTVTYSEGTLTLPDVFCYI